MSPFFCFCFLKSLFQKKNKSKMHDYLWIPCDLQKNRLKPEKKIQIRKKNFGWASMTSKKVFALLLFLSISWWIHLESFICSFVFGCFVVKGSRRKQHHWKPCQCSVPRHWNHRWCSCMDKIPQLTPKLHISNNSHCRHYWILWQHSLNL